MHAGKHNFTNDDIVLPDGSGSFLRGPFLLLVLFLLFLLCVFTFLLLLALILVLSSALVTHVHSSVIKLTNTDYGGHLFVLKSDQSQDSIIEYSNSV